MNFFIIVRVSYTCFALTIYFWRFLLDLFLMLHYFGSYRSGGCEDVLPDVDVAGTEDT